MDWRKCPHPPPLSSLIYLTKGAETCQRQGGLLGQGRGCKSLCSFPWLPRSLKGVHRWHCQIREAQVLLLYSGLTAPSSLHDVNIFTVGSAAPWTKCHQDHIFIYRKKAESVLRHPHIISHLPPCGTKPFSHQSLHFLVKGYNNLERYNIIPKVDFEYIGIMLICCYQYNIIDAALCFSILGNSIFWRIWIQ